jgi:predicted negative regulator of RcsB-dependent stress response
MAAPVVTRPPTAVEEPASPGGMNMEAVTQWARWVVVACVIVGAVGLIAVAVVSFNDNRKSERSRQTWDEVFKALKDKNKPEQIVAALEGLADKVVGTPTHAYVLMELGDTHFKDSTNPSKSVEDRANSLKKAEAIFETVATKEPYASNPAFGPLAIEGLALSLEQEQKYDKAIALIDENLGKWESHFLRNKLASQLGRLYYLRSLTKEGAEAEKDRTAAREKLTDVLRQAGDQENGKWKEQALFIKALVDKPGKALIDGKVPPAKIPVAPPVGGAGPAEKKDEAKKDVPAATPAATEKKDEKKDAPKKDDAKKEEPKKTGSVEPRNLPASEHLSFAQIQQALKEGRTAFCGCARCATNGGDKEVKARLVE